MGIIGYDSVPVSGTSLKAVLQDQDLGGYVRKITLSRAACTITL